MTTVLAACGGSGQVAKTSPSPAPAASGRTLSGGTASLSSLRGHPVVVVFWASWCSPCRDEQPRLNAAYAAWSTRGVAFLGVDMLDDQGRAFAFQTQMNVPYASVVDPDAAIATDYEVPAAPALVFVDAAGRVTDRVLGGLGLMSEADFNGEIASLLAHP